MVEALRVNFVSKVDRRSSAAVKSALKHKLEAQIHQGGIRFTRGLSQAAVNADGGETEKVNVSVVE